METNSILPVWILALPLIGFLLSGVVYPLAGGGNQSVPVRLAGVTASLVMATAFLLGV